MESNEVSPTPSCNDNSSFLSFMPINITAIIFIVSLCLTVLLCCVSSILCCIVCIMCRRRHKTSDLQDLPKSDGYVMPVIEEEKDLLDTLEPSADTFRSGTRNEIINEDVQRDVVIHHETVITPSHNSHQNKFFGTDTPIKEDIEVDNPLYLTKDGSPNNNGSTNRKYFTLNTPVSQQPHTLGTRPMDICNDVNDYENESDYVNENDHENGNDYKNSSVFGLGKLMVAQQAASLPTTRKTPSNNKPKPPPETKPKPKHKQRKNSTPSETSQYDQPNNVPNIDEPHYMALKKNNQIPWKGYKELDFLTVDPTGEYTVLTRATS